MDPDVVMTLATVALGIAVLLVGLLVLTAFKTLFEGWLWVPAGYPRPRRAPAAAVAPPTRSPVRTPLRKRPAAALAAISIFLAR